MPEKSLPDLIMELMNKDGKPFMTVKRLALLLGTAKKRELGILHVTNATEIKNIIEPLLEDRFIFNKKGTSLYILVPCKPEDLILKELSAAKGKSPKAVGRLMPFTKKDCMKILLDLIEKGRIRLTLNETLEPRIFLTDAPCNEELQPQTQKKEETPYTLENFYKAFKSLDNGRIFVRICDLRRALKWPRDVFDSGLKQLRDAGIIQLHVGDASLMTPDDIRDSFVDENHFRMGTVTWHGK